MKVITEERLKEIVSMYCETQKSNTSLHLDGMVDMLDILWDELEEIGTLTFSKLRPMCDAPINIPIIVKYIKSDELLSVCLSADSKLRCYEGWIPMPIYKPEKE